MTTFLVLVMGIIGGLAALLVLAFFIGSCMYEINKGKAVAYLASKYDQEQ